MIVIRADANEHIASGHVMRCLSLADALFSLGQEIVFITSDDYAAKLVTDRDFKVICFNNDYNDKEGELDRIIAEIEKISPELILIDSYQVTADYLQTIRDNTGSKLAYIDDLNAFDYPVDIVINYSIYANDIDYPNNKTYLLGTQYVPLRKQFELSEDILNRSIIGRSDNRQILITTGAADPYHISGKIIRSILNEPLLSEYKLSVVRGRFWENDEILNEVSKYGKDRIRWYENVENMADLMLPATMAVSAGGSTLYELCACLVPTVTIACADNQLGNVNGFAERGIMQYAGDVRNNPDISENIVKILLSYHENNDIMDRMIGLMRRLSCGKGSLHLAEELVRRITE